MRLTGNIAQINTTTGIHTQNSSILFTSVGFSSMSLHCQTTHWLQITDGNIPVTWVDMGSLCVVNIDRVSVICSTKAVVFANVTSLGYLQIQKIKMTHKLQLPVAAGKNIIKIEHIYLECKEYKWTSYP